MQPLVESFTKNLQPCSGCGNSSAVDEFFRQKLQPNGDKMQFVVQVVVEADNLKQALNKIPDNVGDTISGTPYRSPVQPQGIIAGSQFQTTTTGRPPAPQGA